MADVAAAGRPETTDFADRIGREVIVQHEVRVAEAVEAVDHLLAVLGAERAGRDRLRLAAREQRRAVGAGQEVRFGKDGTNLRRRASVDALAVLADGAARSAERRGGKGCVSTCRSRW